MCRCPHLKHLHIDILSTTYSIDSLFTFLSAHPGLLSLSLYHDTLEMSSYPHILCCCPFLTSLSINTRSLGYYSSDYDCDSLYSMMNTTDWAHLAPRWRDLQIYGSGGGVVLHQYMLPVLAAIGSQLRSLHMEDGMMSAWQDIGQYCPHLVELDISEYDGYGGCLTEVGGCGGRRAMNGRESREY